MSTTYNLEPQPTAKAILHTTSGDLTVELWHKQTPLACQNFLQHCLDGYYNNTIFHRLIPGFIIQGGDPTGTGSGGISAINNGDGLEVESHSRLKFNRRGLLGMAVGEDGKNGSQFFFTLGNTPELGGKYTMFGRIEGDTIFNLIKMSEAELAEEGSERPLYPTRITGTEVLVNPFEDMVARVKEAPRMREEGSGKSAGVKKRKKPAGKNVLSFGLEEGEEDAAPVAKKPKANPKLVSVGMEEPQKMNNTKMPEAKASAAEKVRKPRRQEEIIEREPEEDMPIMAAPLPLRKPTDDEESDDGEPEADTKPSALERTNAEIAALKASMKRTADIAPKEKEKPKSAFEALIPISSTRGRKRSKASDERGAIDMFKAFKQRLEDLPPSAAPTNTTTAPASNAHLTAPTTTEAAADDDEAALCDLHFIANCQSCKSWDDEEPDAEAEADEDDGTTWMAHSLSFAKDMLGKDLEWKKQMEGFEVIDPREKARGLKEERRRGKEKVRR